MHLITLALGHSLTHPFTLITLITLVTLVTPITPITLITLITITTLITIIGLIPLITGPRERRGGPGGAQAHPDPPAAPLPRLKRGAPRRAL